MDELVAIVRNLITEVNGAPEAVWAAVLEHIRTDPAILLDGWNELAELGAAVSPLARGQVAQARQLVSDVLHALGAAADERGPEASAVARGLVIITRREIVEYTWERRTTPRPASRGRRRGRAR
jgi:hypothetical protein